MIRLNLISRLKYSVCPRKPPGNAGSTKSMSGRASPSPSPRPLTSPRIKVGDILSCLVHVPSSSRARAVYRYDQSATLEDTLPGPGSADGPVAHASSEPPPALIEIQSTQPQWTDDWTQACALPSDTRDHAVKRLRRMREVRSPMCVCVCVCYVETLYACMLSLVLMNWIKSWCELSPLTPLHTPVSRRMLYVTLRRLCKPSRRLRYRM